VFLKHCLIYLFYRGLLWYPSIHWNWNSLTAKESGSYVQSTSSWPLPAPFSHSWLYTNLQYNSHQLPPIKRKGGSTKLDGDRAEQYTQVVEGKCYLFFQQDSTVHNIVVLIQNTPWDHFATENEWWYVAIICIKHGHKVCPCKRATNRNMSSWCLPVVPCSCSSRMLVLKLLCWLQLWTRCVWLCTWK
jgi:hypothetical protein